MTLMDRLELVWRLRALCRQLTVVLSSGCGLAELEANRWSFAEKPFRTDALAQTVTAARRPEVTIRARPGDRA